MAVRYTGDMTIRLFVQKYGGRTFYAADVSVNDWHHKPVTLRYVCNVNEFSVKNPRASESYDKAALGFAKVAMKEVAWARVDKDSLGRIEIRRVFQAPCPR